VAGFLLEPLDHGLERETGLLDYERELVSYARYVCLRKVCHAHTPVRSRAAEFLPLRFEALLASTDGWCAYMYVTTLCHVL
jgi:hypothetical protein